MSGDYLPMSDPLPMRQISVICEYVTPNPCSS